MHIEHLMSLCTVEDIEYAIENLSSELPEVYRRIILDILAKFPISKDHSLLKRMFVWLCQANYCLPLPEFVAMVNMTSKDGTINKKAIPIKPEEFCYRLGPLLNLDRHVHPPEVNLSHATMEQYLQSDVLRNDPNPKLRELWVSPLAAQKFLGEECLRFLQMDDFRTPLSERRTTGENPFKGLHGGLNAVVDSENFSWVEKMRKRLLPPHGCVGLEYASINWPEHIRRAGYTAEEFHKRVLPILDNWFKTRDERYQSWQEAHAYFCSSAACQCHKWQEPEHFLRTFQLLELYRRAQAIAREPKTDDLEFTTEDILDVDNSTGGASKCRTKFDCSSCGRRHSTPMGVLVPELTTLPKVGEVGEVPSRNGLTGAACAVAKVSLNVRLGKKLGKEPRQEQIRLAQEDTSGRAPYRVVNASDT
jgi:hypothetical protein